MKTPALLGPDGKTALRDYAGYHGGAGGFGGQLRAWNPPSESADAALLPNFSRGNARVVPPAKLTEGLTWMITGLGMGVALGAVLGGWVVDAYGAQAGFSVSLAAGGVMLLFAVLGYRLLQDSTLPRAIAA